MDKFKNIEYDLETKKTRQGYDFVINFKDGEHGKICTAIEPLVYSIKNKKYAQEYCINIIKFQIRIQEKELEQNLLQEIIKIITVKEKRKIGLIIIYPKTNELKEFVKMHEWIEFENGIFYYLTLNQFLTKKGGL
jgi:hypothetical protein